jgi:molecular chaperone GrpE
MTVKEDKKTGKDKPADETEDLKKQLEEANAKAGEYLQLAQRLQADYDNFRKRTQRENEEFKTFATAGLITDMLTIVDDMDRALEHADGENDFVIGVRGIRQNLMKALESRGLSEIPTDGKFDPNCHEALCVVEADEDGDIAEVFQKGYRLGNKVLRYSKVKVTKKKEEEKIEGE